MSTNQKLNIKVIKKTITYIFQALTLGIIDQRWPDSHERMDCSGTGGGTRRGTKDRSCASPSPTSTSCRPSSRREVMPKRLVKNTGRIEINPTLNFSFSWTHPSLTAHVKTMRVVKGSKSRDKSNQKTFTLNSFTFQQIRRQNDEAGPLLNNPYLVTQ